MTDDPHMGLYQTHNIQPGNPTPARVRWYQYGISFITIPPAANAVTSLVNTAVVTIWHMIRVKDHQLSQLINIAPLPHYFSVIDAHWHGVSTISITEWNVIFFVQPWWKSHNMETHLPNMLTRRIWGVNGCGCLNVAGK